MNQKMRELIGPQLSTGSGTDWLIKALHPSDPLTEVRGIPDQSSMPTTLLNWQSDVVIRPTPGATGTWSADLTLLPDPCMFGRWKATDNQGTTYGFQLNSQLSPTGTYGECLRVLLAGAERWRLAYAGVTIYQDGPTLSDQGTVVAAQVPMEPRIFAASATATTPNGDPISCAAAPVQVFQAEDVPNYADLVRMPNAYFSQSKYGCYMPLKLGTNHQRWCSAKDLVWDGTSWPVVHATTPAEYPIIPAVTTFAGFPYGANDASATNQTCAFFEYANGTWSPIGATRSRLMNENVAHACFQNMSTETRLVAYFRFGVEIQCLPSSVYSPYLKLSPPYDQAAIESYYRISRELKDAYPADYNDLGKLWGVIKSVAAKVLPFVGAFGPVGQIISTIGNAVLATSRQSEQLKRDKAIEGGGERNPPPAAMKEEHQLERAVQAVTPRKLTVVRRTVAKPVRRRV